jgi:hypothetical protein
MADVPLVIRIGPLIFRATCAGALFIATLHAGAQNVFDRELEEARRIRRVADQFAHSHPAIGKEALSYFRSLRREGFTCVARQYEEVIAGEGMNLGRFRTVESPIVDCARVPSGFTECARFRVTVLTDRHTAEDLPRYVASLADRKISKTFFVCEPTLRTESIRQFEKDISSGNAVVIR